MPTFEYECKHCSYRTEMFHPPDVKVTRCPECKHETLVRLISGGCGVIFKGSGFYETDYKRKGDRR